MKEDDNKEILSQLENKPPQEEKPKLNLEEELKRIEHRGKTDYAWAFLKMNIIHKYQEVINKSFPIELLNHPLEEDSNKEIEDNIDKDIVDYIVNLNKMPFTLQRMAELLLYPNQYYKTADKYNSAFKKLVNIDPE